MKHQCEYEHVGPDFDGSWTVFGRCWKPATHRGKVMGYFGLERMEVCADHAKVAGQTPTEKFYRWRYIR